MKKYKLMLVSLPSVVIIASSSFLVSCNNKKTEENNSQDNLQPTINLNQIAQSLKVTKKENIDLSTIDASTIKTQTDLENYFDVTYNQVGNVIVNFKSVKVKNNDSKVLEVIYVFKLKSEEIERIIEIPGFKDLDKNDNQDNLQPTINLNQIAQSLKVTKKENIDLSTIDASTIKTQTDLENYFDVTYNQVGNVIVNFKSVKVKNNDSKVLEVIYVFKLKSEEIERIIEIPGFKDLDIEQDLNQEINYRIILKRTNGVVFTNYFPEIKIYDMESTNPLIETNESLYEWNNKEPIDGILNIKLPKQKYRVEVSFSKQGYSFENEYIIWPTNPNLEILFDAKLLETEVEPDKKFYEDEVMNNFEFTDVLNNKISLKQNSNEKKLTIFIFFKTTCPFSQRTLNKLYHLFNEEKLSDKVEVVCFSNNDTTSQLVSFANQYSYFKFVDDRTSNFRNHFFPPEKWPRIAMIDYQGVVTWTYSIGEPEKDLLKEKIQKFIYKNNF